MLKPQTFTQFTTQEVSPEGWLRKQLEIQARGLSGNLDKVWPDVSESKWIGGTKEGWERVPYWLDGFIPLAWLLNDEDMKARAHKYVDAILKGQQADGWICPCDESERSRYDMWALYLICKVMILYHDCTQDERIEEAVYHALKQFNRHMESHTIFNWAQSRWYECLIPVFWLYRRRPEDWMLDLCHKLEEQGIDYEKTYKHWRYSKPHEHGRWSQMTHVVNTGMMLKSRALFSLITGEDANAFAKSAIRTLLKDHGMAAEHFSGDECLSGTSPLRGSELCSVVEAMYSYEWLMAITGDSEWADRLEKAAFNALPATISPDMWTHQYDQLTNQVECSILPEGTHHFLTNDNDSHIFGLEPHFGCCTANFNQGWPKFALSTMMNAEDGIAITAIAPSRLKTKVNGVDVEVGIITDYPFEDGYQVTVDAAAAVEFTLYLRVPNSAKAVTVDCETVSANEGWFLMRRKWAGKTSVNASFTFVPELVRRPSGMYCVWRGPLLYALPIKEQWQKREYVKNGVERKYPYCDYEIYPQSKWNYGFASDNPDNFRWQHHEVGDVPFQAEKPPVTLTADMVEIKWGFANGLCAEKPLSLSPQNEAETINLIPYGCTTLRMTEMPVL